METWESTDATEIMARLVPYRVGPEVAERALSILITDPSTAAYLRSEPDGTELGEDGRPKYFVRRTRVFIDLRSAKELRGDVYAAIAVWIATHSASLATGVALFRKLVRTVRLLSDEELDLAVIVAAVGATHHGTPVPRAAIVAACDGVEDGLDTRLASMTQRGILIKDSAGWQLAP